MYSNNSQNEKLMQLYREEKMRQAEKQALIDEQSGAPLDLSRIYGPALARLGSALEHAGSALQDRYGELEKFIEQPVAQPCPPEMAR